MKSRGIAVASAACAAALLQTTPSHATWGGSNWEHEIAVYSIKTYETYATYGTWKDSIPPWHTYQDPYEDFYEILMDGCNTTECGHTSSARFQNSAVTVNQMTTTSGTTANRGWSASDLVMFYGHNTQIQPQWEGEMHIFRYDNEFSRWYPDTLEDWRTWGIGWDRYEYHRYTVGDASLANAFAIFYGYNAFTSVLIGKDFPTSGTWYTENTWSQASGDAHTNRLGSEVEWVIANGCNAVTVADDWGTTLALGVNAWHGSWDAMHMVLGHYAGTDIGKLPYLDGFAVDIMGPGYPDEGEPIKQAYFDAHWWISPYDPTHQEDEWDRPGFAQPSAIERTPNSCCFYLWGHLICPPWGCSGDYFSTDKWQPNNMSDLTDPDDYYYGTSWRVRDPI